jgi:predicted phage gp36 major capsid-like protein
MTEYSDLETKAGAQNVGAAFEDFMRAFEAFKETNDERLSAIERRGEADTLVSDKLARIDRTLDETKRIADELALKASRPRLGSSAAFASPAAGGFASRARA